MKKDYRPLLSAAITLSLLTQAVAWSAPAEEADVEATNGQRGSPAEYDPGPAKDSNWPDIFAETPNYRAYGKAIYQAAAQKFGTRDDGKEKFRWVVGPMWYRGRLTPNDVKVFVIGQEGAQDENVSNRTFTGSTGTKMQKFINYFGINRSYLFMNTFIYTITGQYGERPKPGDSQAVVKQKAAQSAALFWLAQDKDSAIVKHRHRMFDEVLRTNKRSLRLVIGVGSAGKDTLATWFNHLKAGSCTSAKLAQGFCEVEVDGVRLRGIGTRHPGAASARNGGAGAAEALKKEFTEKAALVAGWIKKDSDWLEADRGARRDFSKAFAYGDASIPHRDFAFGTNWRMGKDGTTSNRRGPEGIQIFSDNGCYNAMARVNGRCGMTPDKSLKYDEVKDNGGAPELAAGDVPWESPKSKSGRLQYDQGPGDLARALVTGWPNFSKMGVISHASFGYNGIYRGNLENPVVLVLADQESNDDLFSGRALTGTGGQRLQTVLNGLGAQGRYAIIRTLPVDTMTLTADMQEKIALNPTVAQVRDAILEKLLDQGKTKLVITVGPIAAEAIKAVAPKAPVVNFDLPNLRASVEQWKGALREIKKLDIAGLKDASYDGDLSPIPREDLPVHTRIWMGTTGTRTSQAYNVTGSNKVPNGDYYQFDAPSWVNERSYPADPKKLSKDEAEAVEAFKKAKIELRNLNAPSDDDDRE